MSSTGSGKLLLYYYKKLQLFIFSTFLKPSTNPLINNPTTFFFHYNNNKQGYDLSCNTYSPDGRVFQVEYANKAVESAGCAIGIQCTDGVVIGIEKLVRSPLLVPGSNRRVFTVDKHTGIAFAGWDADGRPLAEVAMNEAMSYKYKFGVPIPPHELADRLALYMHYHTTEGYMRPFGAALLLAGYDEHDKRAYLHLIEPSGIQFRYRGCSAGKARPTIKTEIEKLDLDHLTCRDALKQLARIVRIVHQDEREKTFEFEASWICQETNWQHHPVSRELRTEADEWAKQKLNEEEGLMDVVVQQNQ
jgi:20S proteasome subunit alpha 7